MRATTCAGGRCRARDPGCLVERLGHGDVWVKAGARGGHRVDRSAASAGRPLNRRYALARAATSAMSCGLDGPRFEVPEGHRPILPGRPRAWLEVLRQRVASAAGELLPEQGGPGELALADLREHRRGKHPGRPGLITRTSTRAAICVFPQPARCQQHELGPDYLMRRGIAAGTPLQLSAVSLRRRNHERGRAAHRRAASGNAGQHHEGSALPLAETPRKLYTPVIIGRATDPKV